MKRKIFQLFSGFFIVLALAINSLAYAAVIGPNTIITTDTNYSNTTVDLTGGNFIVKNGATLTIANSTIIGTISAINPNLISVELGSLNLTSNNFSVSAAAVNPTPGTEASYYVVRLGRASLNFSGNTFVVDKPFTVGLATTSLTLPSKNLTVDNNSFENFHGVLYLLNSFNSTVTNNVFKLNSAGHVVLVGNQANIANNSFYFSGRDKMGNAMDIVDSDNVTISKNNIFTPTSQSITAFLSSGLVIDSNTITGGITYAINLQEITGLKKSSPHLTNVIAFLTKKGFKHQLSTNVTISNNYMGQNRYGITAVGVDSLSVTGNFFTQRFMTAAERKFWTDNSVLLQNVTNLTWTNNYYKEAFTQVNGGDNSLTDPLVLFPVTGGVVL